MSLEKLYYDLKKPSAYTGYKTLKNISKKPKSEVKSWLHKQNTYTRHFPIKRKFARRPTYANDIDHIWQADLADMRQVSSFNNRTNYILTCIDIFSKYAWAIPLKNKTAQSIKIAFEKIFQDGRYPKKLQTDKGREFINSDFQQYLRTKNIHFYTSQDDITKAAVVERFNRTLKSKIYKHFTTTGAKKYIHVLNQLVENYNFSKHRTIGMTPKEASLLNSQREKAALYYKIYKNKENQKFSKKTFKIGDLVRISKRAVVFDRGYLPNFTSEVFRVRAIHKGKPNLYLIEDKNGEMIKGRFYAEEMVLFTGKQFSNLIRRRKNGGSYEYLVAYNFHPPEYVSYRDYMIMKKTT